MKKLIYSVSLLTLCLFLSSWGTRGHKIINKNIAACLPAQMAFFNPGWTDVVTNYASAADYRKNQDPNESPRHYINIDYYPEFVQTGRISSSYDSLIAKYGYVYVIDKGILPWATIDAFDSLKSAFRRGDWNKSALVAADLGHYIGDGHMPLHITKNYNGQFTGQSGIHSRYETSLISRYESQIVYPVDSVQYIRDVSSYVFSYIYRDYSYVDSVMLADTYATNQAGGVGSTEYYQAFWEKAGNFTILMMRNATDALASLIYTAWVQAGSPRLHPNGTGDIAGSAQGALLKVFPGPSGGPVSIRITLPENESHVSLNIYDSNGKPEGALPDRAMTAGTHETEWNPGNLAPGIYLCVLKSGKFSATAKFNITR